MGTPAYANEQPLFGASTIAAEYTPDQEDLRRRVLHAVVHQKWRPSAAVRMFGVSRTAIHNWTRAHRSGGLVALRSQPRGRPKASRLAGHQAATAVRLITDRCPDQLKMPFVLWTREAVRIAGNSSFSQRFTATGSRS